jgi:hypothetical protein
MQSTENKILRRIRHKGKSFSFTAKDFLDLGSRGAVDMALSALTKQGKIRRISRGLYDYPKHSELLGGMLAADFDQVAHAIARRSGIRIQPSGALAANLLGLSEQVPAKLVYLTDGPSRTIRLGTQTITFKQTSPKELLPNEKTALVVHALRFLGKEAVTDEVIRKLRNILSPAERKRLLKNAKYTSTWIPEVVRRIAEKPSDG